MCILVRFGGLSSFGSICWFGGGGHFCVRPIFGLSFLRFDGARLLCWFSFRSGFRCGFFFGFGNFFLFFFFVLSFVIFCRFGGFFGRCFLCWGGCFFCGRCSGNDDFLWICFWRRLFLVGSWLGFCGRLCGVGRVCGVKRLRFNCSRRRLTCGS